MEPTLLTCSAKPPGAQKIGIVNDTSDIKATGQWDEINDAAAKFEIKIVMTDARRPEDVAPAFRNFKAEGVDVVIVLQSNFLILDRANLPAAAAATRLRWRAAKRHWK